MNIKFYITYFCIKLLSYLINNGIKVFTKLKNWAKLKLKPKTDFFHELFISVCRSKILFSNFYDVPILVILLKVTYFIIKISL